MTAVSSRAPWQNPRVVSTLMLVFLAGAMRFALDDRLRYAAATPDFGQCREASLQQLDEGRPRLQAPLYQGPSQKIAIVLADCAQYDRSVQDQLDSATGSNRP